MKRKLIVILILISPVIVSGQTKILNISEIAKHVSSDLLQNYKPDSVTLSKTCRRGFLLIKFKINEKGKISDLAFSKDSTAFIIAALKEAVYSLESDVRLVNTLKISSRTIIQPFIYMYQEGCNFPRITSDATPAESAKFYGSYLMISGQMDHIDDAVSDILNFNDTKLPALDGILLNPIFVASGSME